MEELTKIAKLIKERTDKEFNVKNPSIGGGTVDVNGQRRYIWIVNYEIQSSSRAIYDIQGNYKGTQSKGYVHTLQEYGKNSVAVSKNKKIAEELMRHYGLGHRVGNIIYDIYSSYIWGSNVHGLIKIGTVSRNKWEKHKLKQLLDYNLDLEEAIQKGDAEAIEKTIKKLDELAQSTEEAYHFIREQAELRNNPILDEAQNDAKFAHVFDGFTEVIDGGPGTGKTTSLIQRLKYLITPDDIDDRRESEGLKPLTIRQREILSAEKNTWLFLSPTQLLRKYLRSNMLYEGLSQADDQTVVWNEHLQKILRDEYMLAGNDMPFSFRKKPLKNLLIYQSNSLNIVTEFEEFYLKTLINAISKTSELDYSFLSWKEHAQAIISVCNGIKQAKDFEELIKGLLKLEALRAQKLGPKSISIKDIAEEHNSKLKAKGASVYLRIQKDVSLLNKLFELVASWENPEDEDIESPEEETQQNLATQSREVRLNSYLRNTLRTLALKRLDKSTELKGRQKMIFDEIKHLIQESDYSDVSELAYFHKNFIPIASNIENFLLGRICSAYKRFRINSLKEGNVNNWQLDTLDLIINKYKNKLIHPHEQAVLLGFINNLILTIRKISINRYDTLSHKYAVAFKNCCRPILGVDEATDYSIFDYYAIASLKHPEFSSVTLTGDIMQCLNESGITDWSILRDKRIFPNLDIKELTISYRQSPKLLALADFLYLSNTGKQSPYKGLLEDNQNIPLPLWYSSDNHEDKAEWIARRILEVKHAYKQVPSIAIFVSSADQVPVLKHEIEEIEILEDEGIDIVDCSNGLVDAKNDTVRIFPIDMVKGMEFEVVFFHNIETIANTKLIDRYLYIGLSRASFYMGVTSSSKLDNLTNDIKSLFNTTGNWKQLTVEVER